MTNRRLEQIYPPGVTASDASEAPNIEIRSTSSSLLEGTVSLYDGRSIQFLAYRDGQQVHVWLAGESYVFAAPASATRSHRAGQATSDDIVCPVPGVVIAVHVAVDDTVEIGQDLVVIESMKTEQIVKSPRAGTVQRVSIQEGDRVDRGMRLVVLVPVEEGD